MSTTAIGFEKRIIIAATLFSLALTGVIAMSVRVFGIGLPTCLTDVRPFHEGKVILQAPKRYEIHYLARMWKFEPAEISIVPGSTADIYLSTADVTHGMQIVGTNLNLMAVPGAVNYARVRFDKAGDYLVVCNEYCGISHHQMAAHIHVTESAAPPVAAATPAPLGGQEVLDKYACTACHSLDGSAMPGPTFKGLYGSKRTMADGTIVVADEAYLRESIEKPNAKVVKGFDPLMPETTMSPAELRALTQFIKTLK
ncbi:MAG TPA: c-type cytochrome [Thermoanaerobaculia bacterium]